MHQRPVNSVQPRKLLGSKWTHLKPKDQEKHFLVSRVDFGKQGRVSFCVIQAVINEREYVIDWRTLKDASHWQLGWH